MRAHCVVIVVGIVMSGCTSASMTRRPLETRRSYQRLKFDSATTVVVMMNRSADDPVSSVWTGVLELGGLVETVRGDTLIIEPNYILRVVAASSGDTRVVRFSDMRVLPDLVFIPAEPGFRLVSPIEHRRKGPSISSIVIFGLIALDMYVRWPRG